MIKAKLENRVTEVELDGTEKELVCEAMSVLDYVFKSVDEMNKYILIAMIREVVEGWKNEEGI